MKSRLWSLGVAMLLVATLVAPAALAGSKLQIAYPVGTSEEQGRDHERPVAPHQGPRDVPYAPTGQGYVGEIEPNGTYATATPLGGSNVVARGNIYPGGDVDFFSFDAVAGDRVYAAVMTSFSANASTDSQLTLYQPNGTTQIEFDDNDGSLGVSSSSIAGASIAADGTYYLKVNHFTATTGQLRPYEFHFRLQSGSPTPEVEANDTPATANPLPANGWVSGARDPALATEQDWYSMTLSAGDTVFLSLDLDPERDNVQWNGRLGIALFGDAGNQILVIDDGSGGSVANPLSEALFFTVKDAGTYFAFVDSATASTGGPTATYTLSVSVHSDTYGGPLCTTYTSTNVPQTIGPTNGLVSSTITVPGNPRIADLDVYVQLSHALMADLDVHLRSPAGNDNGLFTDIGTTATGGQTQMDAVFDDEAGVPPTWTVLKNVQLKPELAYRLSWFDGENAGGTWTLDLYDDTNNASGGTLTAWSLRVCEEPPPPPCAAGYGVTTVFSTDFESGVAGFTHSGTADEWALGLPNEPAASGIAAFTTCNSGVNCWKTDLTGTYDVSSSQDLLSAPIDLTGLVAPVTVTWAQRYQMESASFDHMFVDYQQVGGATPVRLFEWLDATMSDIIASPATNIGESAGWGLVTRRADSLAGLSTELRFHLDSETTVNLPGLAIDDVSVRACKALPDMGITKSDSPDPVVIGGTLTYTIEVTNSGPGDATGVTVTDGIVAGSFQSAVSTVGTCNVNAGGDLVTCDIGALASGAGATITLVVTAPGPAGPLFNTASVTCVETDHNPGNESATEETTVIEPVTFTSADHATFTILVPGTFIVTTTFGTVTPVLSVAGALPRGVTFVDHGDGTGALTGTPLKGGAGVFPLTITADTGTTVSQSFTLTVIGARTTVKVAATRNPVAPGQAIKLIAAVSFYTRLLGTPTGLIEFEVDGVLHGGPVPMVSATATSIPWSSTVPGSHTVTVRYLGDSSFAPCTATLIVTVQAPT